MALSIENPDYHVDTFADMQESLANYLNEASDNDGNWTETQKKRHLNLGCINVAAATMAPRTVFEEIVQGTSSASINTFDVPGDMLKPYRLWIGGLQFQEVSDEVWLSNISSLDSTGNAINARVFWWDEDSNKVHFSPASTNTQKVVFRYVRMPRRLVEDDDIPDLHPLLWHVPPMWAAWRMLYRDEEHGDRGRSARADYRDAIKEFQKFKFKNIGNKQDRIILDPLVFPRKAHQLGNVDLGDNFDIFD